MQNKRTNKIALLGIFFIIWVAICCFCPEDLANVAGVVLGAAWLVS
jgi:hypothetical protein